MDKQKSDINAILKIKANYDSLRKSEKKVADYILQHPDQIVYQSITTLAENVKVSDTSVIRLCKAIGFDGFQDFKLNVALGTVEPSKQIYDDIALTDDLSTIISKVKMANVRAIEDTMNFMDARKLKKATEIIAKTTRLEFYGVGGSGIMALDAQHTFFKYIDGTCVAYADPHMQAMSAATMKPGDVVVGISNTGATKDTVESLRIAKEAGATIISITGSTKNPVTRVSDIAFTIIAKESYSKPEPMSTRICVLSIIDTLATAVALTRPEKILANLKKTRDALANKRF